MVFVVDSKAKQRERSEIIGSNTENKLKTP